MRLRRIDELEGKKNDERTALDPIGHLPIMRLVHYYPRAVGDSGVTVAIQAWAGALQAIGVDVAILHAGVVDRDEPVGIFREPTIAAVSVETVPHAGSRRATLRPIRLEHFLRDGDVLILHEGWVLSNVVAAAAARHAGTPYVATPHGVYDPRWRRYLRPPRRLREVLFERPLLERALAVHTFFESENQPIAKIAPGATFLTVPTGYDSPDESWAGGGGYLAWVGRYDPVHKGLDVLAEALGLLPESDRPLIKLRGYDYKGGKRRLQRLIQQARLEPWMEVGGVIGGHAKRDFLVRSEGAVLPSRWEAHSVSLLESMALGLPNLVSSAIPIAPLLRRTQAAILSVPEPRPLADALLRLPLEAPIVGGNARALIRTSFAWRPLAEQYAAGLRHLLAKEQWPQ